MALTRLERANAAQRIGQEGGKLQPLIELVFDGGPSVDSMKRWIKRGKGGRKLDAIEDERGGWLSTHQALRRFLKHIEAAGAKPQPT